ncbi:hypothetical protein M2480_001198 [Parabacteroides sp. PFB2-12]|uniref:lipoprotein N-acyltransferase Lnb domain-containing protein n=1 Tax=unclassified Parabacteroides TaxID=2649774 RepID=UPI0024745625|nr:MULTISPECIES: DUF4105 domain-containing protein [unclassified Parabacteroides]MDH6342576.1 hypothetical protein [Parabacteroides sp. PM6-13]MDH6390228.1 hypothetical protein [Parabacteroides sp. PFB2-12]
MKKKEKQGVNRRLSWWVGLCLVILLGTSTRLSAQATLSDQAEISFLISAPYDEAAFTVFGHAAIRVYDPVTRFDGVFNYGIFDFSSPNFVWRFALGHTDYILGINDYKQYLANYQMRGSDVTELVLNLTPYEKQGLFEGLILNAQPENRTYRYNFFFDNCATRLPAMVERYTRGEVIYHNPPAPQSFRQMVHDCTRHRTWLTFGIDLALGSPADRVATPHEMMFLPSFVMQAYEHASILDPEGTEREMVSEKRVNKAFEEEDTFDILDDLLTPMVCGWLLFLVVLFFTYRAWKQKRAYNGLDILLFSLAGIGGCVLFFLCFVSVHPCIWPNWSVVWLHPLHWVGVVLFSVKKMNKAAYWYHFINFAALSLLLIGWFFIPQQMNAAFIPLILILWMRSGYRIYDKKRTKK